MIDCKFQELLMEVIGSDTPLNFGTNKWCYKFVAGAVTSFCLSVCTKLAIDASLTVDMMLQQLGNLYFSTALATWFASTRLIKLVIERTSAELVITEIINIDVLH
jgi:hypothetical protein